MTNQDQAAQVIRTWQKRHKNVMDSNPDWAAQNLAGDLHQAGLLAPELPEPVEESGSEAWWEPCGLELLVTSYKERLTGRHLIAVDNTTYAMEAQEARRLGLALLAAANHTEEA